MALEITDSGKIKVPRGYGEARQMIIDGTPVEQVAAATGKDPAILKEIAAAAKKLPKKDAKKPAKKAAKSKAKKVEPEEVDVTEDEEDDVDSLIDEL